MSSNHKNKKQLDNPCHWPNINKNGGDMSLKENKIIQSIRRSKRLFPTQRSTRFPFQNGHKRKRKKRLDEQSPTTTHTEIRVSHFTHQMASFSICHVVCGGSKMLYKSL